MKRKLPPFPALRAFEAAARLGSFKAAADELCVTASAISHQVRTLETFLGRPLFERGVRQNTLTADGRVYLRQTGPLLDQLDASTRMVAGEICAGPLFLRMTEGFMHRWLIPRLSRFLERYPEIDVHMEGALPPTEFHAGRPDIVIHWGDTPVAGAVVEPFMSSTRSPVCSPAYLKAHPDLTAPQSLAGKVLLRDETGDAWPELFSLIGRPGHCPAGGPKFAHCELTSTAAENGVGVALGYIDMIGETLRRGTLVMPFDVQLPTRTIYSVAYETAKAHEPRIVAFRDWLFEQVMAETHPEPGLLQAAQ